MTHAILGFLLGLLAAALAGAASMAAWWKRRDLETKARQNELSRRDSATEAKRTIGLVAAEKEDAARRAMPDRDAAAAAMRRDAERNGK